MKYKGYNSVRTTFAAIACTLVISTTCLMGAVGPATAQAAAKAEATGAIATTAYPGR